MRAASSINAPETPLPFTTDPLQHNIFGHRPLGPALWIIDLKAKPKAAYPFLWVDPLNFVPDFLAFYTLKPRPKDCKTISKPLRFYYSAKNEQGYVFDLTGIHWVKTLNQLLADSPSFQDSSNLPRIKNLIRLLLEPDFFAMAGAYKEVNPVLYLDSLRAPLSWFEINLKAPLVSILEADKTQKNWSLIVEAGRKGLIHSLEHYSYCGMQDDLGLFRTAFKGKEPTWVFFKMRKSRLGYYDYTDWFYLENHQYTFYYGFAIYLREEAGVFQVERLELIGSRLMVVE